MFLHTTIALITEERCSKIWC